MSSKLKIFDNRPNLNEVINEDIITEGEDIEKLKSLKQVSQEFLDINHFEIKHEPCIEDLSLDQFKDFVESKSKDSIMVTKFNELNIELNIRSLMSDVYKHKDKENHQIFVYFLPDSKNSANSINKSDLNKFIRLILMLNCNEGLLISAKDLSVTATKLVRNCNSQPGDFDNIYQIITYKDEDFINVTKHAFNPEVTRIMRTKEEISQFMEENRINIKNFKRIWIDDPLSKFYRARAGDVFQFKRTNIVEKSLLTEQISFALVMPSRNGK